jgi:streptogramin lyase
VAPTGYTAHFITAGPLGIFLANSYNVTLVRVDPATNTVTQLADLGNYAGEIVELDGSLWVNTGSALVEVDPNTGRVVRTIARGVRDIGSDGRSLWASTNRPEVLRIAPRTGQVETAELPAGVRFAIGLAADPATGAVWAASDPSSQGLVRVAP